MAAAKVPSGAAKQRQPVAAAATAQPAAQTTESAYSANTDLQEEKRNRLSNLRDCTAAFRSYLYFLVILFLLLTLLFSQLFIQST